MLETIDKTIDFLKETNKKELKKQITSLSDSLSALQHECHLLNLPVIIVFEGFGASGKGTLINQLITPLDPRGFHVYSINKESDEEKKYPFLWRFWIKTPLNGQIAIFDRSWYRRVFADRFDKLTPKEEINFAYKEIVNFEKQLTDDGTIIIKFFLTITKKEQKKRINKLLCSKETSWRVSEADKKRHKQFHKYHTMAEEMLQKTDTDFAPWTIIETQKTDYAVLKILSTVTSRLRTEIFAKTLEKDILQTRNGIKEPKELSATLPSKNAAVLPLSSSVLSSIDLSLSYQKKEYKKKLKELQEKLCILQNKLYRSKIPVILVFEGWDAAGKGGAIKRLTQALDPRSYHVIPISAPNDLEKSHHYLWRFWKNMPLPGHISIFDRSWYGRVMVERIEGFCTKEEWERAYQEINHMEAHLSHYGTVILKFWIQIDKDEQEHRFQERMTNPKKQWKITDEDWRNREKWEQYEIAVDEMINRTSTDYAPWIIVEGNCKYYARIKVLQTVADTLEKKLSE